MRRRGSAGLLQQGHHHSAAAGPHPFFALGLRPFLLQNQPRKRVKLRSGADQGHPLSQAWSPSWGGAPPGPLGPQRPRHTLPRACQLGPNLISALSVRTPLNPIPLITAASLLAARSPPVCPESPQRFLGNQAGNYVLQELEVAPNWAVSCSSLRGSRLGNLGVALYFLPRGLFLPPGCVIFTDSLNLSEPSRAW